MRIQAAFFLLIGSILISGSIYGQNVPVDFETSGNGALWTWTVFENDTNPPLEILQNPDQSGINISPTVAKFTAMQTGNPWAGCESLHGSDIGSFTIDSTNMIIRIMVWKSVISDVGIKLVRFDNWSLGEIKIPNTLVNQWEQITFDFSAHFGNTYDQLVIFPDFNARSSTNVIYFDNVFGPEAVACPAPSPNFTYNVSNLTVDFTDGSIGNGGLSYLWDFGDSGSSVMMNPSHTYAAPGSYAVCLTVTDSCGSDMFCDTVQIVANAIENNSPMMGLSLFPNPNRGKVSLMAEFTSTDLVELRLMNPLGQTIRSFDRTVSAGTFRQEIDLGDAVPGVYFLYVKVGDEVKMLKIVRE